MPMTTDTLTVQQRLNLTGDIGNRVTPIDRTELIQADNVVFPIPFTDWRIHDAIHSPLPGTSAADDLGLYGGAVFGTDAPLIRTYDVKAAGAVTLYALAFVKVPESYVAGQTFSLRFGAGMVTTIADTTATIDVQAQRIGKDNTLGSDICATVAQSINSLTFANKTFAITPSTLEPGDVLQVRVAIAVNDAASGAAVIAAFASSDVVCDIKG